MSVAPPRTRSVPQALQTGYLYAPFYPSRRMHSFCSSWAFAPDGTDVQGTFDQSCTVSALLGLLAVHGCAWALQTTGMPSSAWHLLHVKRGPGLCMRFKLIRGDVLVLDIPSDVWKNVAIVPDAAVVSPDDMLPGAVTPDDTSYFRPYHTR